MANIAKKVTAINDFWQKSFGPISDFYIKSFGPISDFTLFHPATGYPVGDVVGLQKVAHHDAL